MHALVTTLVACSPTATRMPIFQASTIRPVSLLHQVNGVVFRPSHRQAQHLPQLTYQLQGVAQPEVAQPGVQPQVVLRRALSVSRCSVPLRVAWVQAVVEPGGEECRAAVRVLRACQVCAVAPLSGKAAVPGVTIHTRRSQASAKWLVRRHHGGRANGT